MRQRYAAVMVILALLVVGVFSLIPRKGQAQSGDASCPALVELALSQVGNNCAALPRNSACYGFNRVDSTFSQTVSEGFFSLPADRADLVDIESIQTTPLDLGLGQWGIAVLNVQANVPNTLPGQAVTFLLMGDTQVENAVDTAGQTTPSVTVITQAATDLRSEAAAGSSILANLAAGTVLQADAISDDGLALHVVTDSGSGWIDRSGVNATPQLTQLENPTSSGPSPMQAFYFRTGPGQTTCEQTPSILAVQSPEGIKVDLTANGANIRLGSLVTLQVLPGDIMKLTTLEGDALLDADTPNEVDVPAGFTTTRCLSAPDNLGQDGQSNDQKVGADCAWESPKPADLADLEQGQIVQSALERLGQARVESTPVPTAVPPPTSAAPVTTEEPPQTVECPNGQTITHIVSAGENLFRIGLRYNTSIGAIMQANGITNQQLIYTGQRLVIPCGVDTGIPSVPNVPLIPNIPTFVPGQQPFPGNFCGGFRATSPLDGLNYGTNTFYWDPAPGATGYQVNIYNLDERKGALVGTFNASGNQTNLTADLSIQTVGYGFSFAWEVLALFNGAVGCRSGPFTVPRAAAPAGPQGFIADWVCQPSGSTFTISWANVPNGTTALTLSFSGAGTPTSPFVIMNPPVSGSQSFFGFGTISGGAVIASPSGATVRLAPSSLGICP